MSEKEVAAVNIAGVTGKYILKYTAYMLYAVILKKRRINYLCIWFFIDCGNDVMLSSFFLWLRLLTEEKKCCDEFNHGKEFSWLKKKAKELKLTIFYPEKTG